MKAVKFSRSPGDTPAKPVLSTLAVMAIFSRLLAEPVLTSVVVGPQSPDPVVQGGQATNVVTVTRTGNGNMDVYLTSSGLPAGVRASFSPNPVTFTGSSVMSATARLVISTAKNTPPGPNPFTVVADDGASHNIVTNTGTLDVTMGGPGIACMAGGGVCVAFDADSGTQCTVQATTSLATPVWTNLCVTNSGTNNLLIFADRDASKYPMRFYRLKMP